MNSPIRTLPILLTLLSCASASGGAGGPATDLPPRAPEHAWVVFGDDSVRVEVARTESERERGLMFRESVQDGTGMLFVFPRAEIQGVWMKDTYVALDAAFLDEDATVSSIEPLEPGDETVKYSERPVMFVLETPRGWLARRGVSVGDSAVIVFDGGGGGGLGPVARSSLSALPIFAVPHQHPGSAAVVAVRDHEDHAALRFVAGP